MATTETLTLKVDTKVKQALIDSLAKIGQEGRAGAKAADKLDKEIKSLSPAPLNRLASAANRANGGLINMVKNATLMGYNLQGVVLLGVNKLRSSFVDMTDQFNRVIGQMNLLSGSFDEAVRLTRKLQLAAVDTGWTIDDLSSGTTKLITGMSQYGLTADQAIEATRNFGLWMRAMGDVGSRIPKVLGGIALTFQRTTITAEKLESLLGRGRAEQFIKAFGDELIKYKNIDVTSTTYKNLSALQVFDKLIKENTLSHKELSEVMLITINNAKGWSVIASEIGHGYDKLKEAVKLFITQLDFAAGGSNSLASIFSYMAQTLAGLAKHMNTVVGILSAMAGAIALLAIAAIPGKIVLIVTQLAILVKHLGFVKGAIQLITLAMAKNPLTFFFVAATSALIIFRDEVDKLAQRLVKWVEGLKETLGILYGPIKWIVDGLAAIAKSIGLIGKDVTTGGGRGGGTGGTTGGDTGGDTGTGGVPTTAKPAEVGGAYRQYLTLQGQRANLDASRSAGTSTAGQFTAGLAKQNEAWKQLLRTQAVDLKTKPFLTQVIKDNIKATQGAADAYKETNLGSNKALDGLEKQVNNLNIAYENNDITAKEYTTQMAGVNEAAKKLKVTHADEIATYGKVNKRVKKLTEDTNEYATSLKKEAKAKEEAARIQQQLNTGLTNVGHAAIQAGGRAVGGSAGGFLSSVGGGALTGGLAGGPVGAAIGGVTAGIVHIVAQSAEVEAKNWKNYAAEDRRKVKDQVFAFQTQLSNIEKLEGAGRLTGRQALEARAQIHNQIRDFQAINAETLQEIAGREAEGNKRTFNVLGQKVTIGSSEKTGDVLATLIANTQQANDKMLKTQQSQEKLLQEQVDLQHRQLEAAQKQLEVAERERDAAILEARLQAQAARSNVFEMRVLNTSYQNADEFGQIVGGEVA